MPWFLQVPWAAPPQQGCSWDEPAPWGASPKGRRRGEVLKMTRSPALLQESLNGPDSAKSTHRSPPSARTALGGDASLRLWLSALLNGGQGPAWSHPAPAGSLFGAAPWSRPWARVGGRFEILALTESRCIIGKPSGHDRANSHIPGWDGERFTPGARSPRPAPGRLPTSPAPSALIVVLMALLFEADPPAYRGECHYVVF